MKKNEAKSRLIWWVLVLQKFDLEIRYKNGSENVLANHLSRLVIMENETTLPIQENFPN